MNQENPNADVPIPSDSLLNLSSYFDIEYEDLHLDPVKIANFREWLKRYAVPVEDVPERKEGTPGAHTADGIDLYFIWWEQDGFVYGKPRVLGCPNRKVDLTIGYRAPIAALDELPEYPLYGDDYWAQETP